MYSLLQISRQRDLSQPQFYRPGSKLQLTMRSAITPETRTTVRAASFTIQTCPSNEMTSMRLGCRSWISAQRIAECRSLCKLMKSKVVLMIFIFILSMSRPRFSFKFDTLLESLLASTRTSWVRQRHFFCAQIMIFFRSNQRSHGSGPTKFAGRKAHGGSRRCIFLLLTRQVSLPPFHVAAVGFAFIIE